jgi:hypothetical protein
MIQPDYLAHNNTPTPTTQNPKPQLTKKQNNEYFSKKYSKKGEKIW